MRQFLPFAVVLGLVFTSWFLFDMFREQVSDLWMNVAVRPEIHQLMEHSSNDLKQLAQLDPTNQNLYRQRFESLQDLRKTLNILALNRNNLVSRYEWLLALAFISVLAIAAVVASWQHRHTNQRLQKLQHPLRALATGAQIPANQTRGSGLFGRVEDMIATTAEHMQIQRERLRYLEHLDRWQESARWLGHEIRTPLTTLQFELERMFNLEAQTDREQALHRALGELQRLSRFARGFSNLSGIGQPQIEPVDLAAMLQHFETLFGSRWPRLKLAVQIDHPNAIHAVDESMLRQVLVNLCDNTHRAISPASGLLVIHLGATENTYFIDVTDNGPGLPSPIQSNLFVPYTTTRQNGQGLGLGLTISRKIMLDHGGDLVLKDTGPHGTCFRLIFDTLHAQPGDMS